VAESSEREHAEVGRVVLDQLAALRIGDFAAAYRYAAEGIRAQFPPDAFERMVRDGYAALIGWTACDVDAVDLSGDDAVARVRLVAADGILYGVRYQLAREDGEWRVTGVFMGPRITAAFSVNGKRGSG
jgi:hypothetical protein